MAAPYGKVVLITGASSGIGFATATLLSEYGFRVYGTTRKTGFFALQPGYEGGFFKLVTMDVTDDRSVSAALEQILLSESEIGVLINCAGDGIAGAAEDTSPQEAKKQFEVNFFGAHRMIRAVLPGMRARKNGLILNIGSVGGIFALPYQGLYSASKFALEGLTQALRVELKPFHVRAALIDPGDVNTPFTAARVIARGAADSAYASAFGRALSRIEQDETSGIPPQCVARAALKTLLRARPPLRSVVGGPYRLLVFCKRLVPHWIVEAVITRMY